MIMVGLGCIGDTTFSWDSVCVMAARVSVRGSTVGSMPKSKGRQGRVRSGRSERFDGPAGDSVRRTEDMPVGPMADVSVLLGSDAVAPDLLIEMLLPMLWRVKPVTITGNRSIDCSLVLAHAYEHLGIVATSCAVDLMIKDASAEEYTTVGRSDPQDADGKFDGHCVLWLPQSQRFVDAMVDQFPEVRRHQRGPVIGRTAMTSGSASLGTELVYGGIPGDMHVVVRPGMRLLYIVVGPDPVGVVTSSPVVREAAARYRRAGVNLASHALTLFRLPPVIEKVRAARYPQLHAILEELGQAEFFVGREGDFSFAVQINGTDRVLPLDEIVPAAVDPQVSRDPGRRVPHVTFDQDRIRETLTDVDSAARLVRCASPAMGSGVLPVVLFEPRAGVSAQRADGTTVEVQAEGIIRHGFARFGPGSSTPPRLSSWSVVPTAVGVELWEGDGLWARSQVEVEPAWRAAARSHGVVRVIYGVCVGVQAPALSESYSESDRETELLDSRCAGTAAVAEVPWVEVAGERRSRWWRRTGRHEPKADR
jgi:hypothetical protein